MKVLIIGSGGREHALAQAYSESKRVKRIFVAPGNDFMEETNKKILTLPEIGTLDFETIVKFAKKNKINLVDVAQDDPLAEGLVDLLENEGLLTFGPTKKAAAIEHDKIWARNFMQKYNLPRPLYYHFSEEKNAIKFVESKPEQVWFVKASGLAQGKGVIRAENKEDTKLAIKQMKKFGKSGKRFLLEECIVGEEFSLFVICDGKNYKILKAAQDHKRVLTGDQGLNTGGMGCVTPISIITSKLLKEIENKIIVPFMRGMQKEKTPYHGILYIGGMLTKDRSLPAGGQIKIIEFNARWGDPEAEIILPGLKTDYLNLVLSVKNKTLPKTDVKFDNKIRISVAGCARGYPSDYSQALGKKIFGLEKVGKISGIQVFGAGIKKVDKNYVVNGGRIFHLVCEGETIFDARKKAYAAMSQIYIEGNNLHYRTDIGWRELERSTST